MTIGLIFIAVLMLVSVSLTGIGVYRRAEGLITGGVVMLIVLGMVLAARAEQIDKDKRMELCVTSGKEVIKVFGVKVCRI